MVFFLSAETTTPPPPEQPERMNPQYEEIGQAFVEHYYNLFQTSRDQLASLYQDDSMMTFEGSPVQGQAAIAEKFQVCSCNTNETNAVVTSKERAVSEREPRAVRTGRVGKRESRAGGWC